MRIAWLFPMESLECRKTFRILVMARNSKICNARVVREPADGSVTTSNRGYLGTSPVVCRMWRLHVHGAKSYSRFRVNLELDSFWVKYDFEHVFLKPLVLWHVGKMCSAANIIYSNSHLRMCGYGVSMGKVRIYICTSPF